MLHLWCSQESYQETFSHREDCKPSRRTARSKCAFTRGYNVLVGYAGRLFLDLIGVSRATKALQKTRLEPDRTAASACSAEDKA